GATSDGPRERNPQRRPTRARPRELAAAQPEPPTDVIRAWARVDRLETKDRAVRHPLAHRLREDRVAVTRDQRAEGHAEVDVFRSVRIPNPRTFRLANVQRVRIDETVVAVDPEGDPLLCGLPRLRGFLRPPAKRLEFFLPRLHDIDKSALERSHTINGFPHEMQRSRMQQRTTRP